MTLSVLTAGETMLRLLAPVGTRLRHAAALDLGVGGAESNLAVGLARLGHRVAWQSRLGDDEPGRLVLNRLRAEGVETGAVRLAADAPTGLFLRERAPEGGRAHYYRAGSAASTLTPDDIDSALVAAARIVHVTGITPVLSASSMAFTEALIQAARDAGAAVSLDVNFRSRLCSADWLRGWTESVLASVDVLFLSDEEAAVLWQRTPDEALLQRLGEAGPREVVLKGDGGDSRVWTPQGIERAPLFPVTAVDPVGAGDAFAAGYLDGRLRGLPPGERLVQGNAMGALCVLGAGDYEPLPERGTLDAFIAGGRELGR